jgi:hypothetical protein
VFDIVTKTQIEGEAIKTDSVFSKIKCHLTPKETVPDYDLSFQVGGKNNGEKSFVRIRIPTKDADKVQPDDQVTDQYAEDGLVEVDQEDKSFAIKNKDNTILLLNQAAPRCFRNDIINHIKKQVGDYFEHSPDELKSL